MPWRGDLPQPIDRWPGSCGQASGIAFADGMGMDTMRRELRVVFTVGLSLVLASCAVRAGDAPATAPLGPPRPCSVTVFPGMPPFAVDDLGPIQAPCPNSPRHWTACGIDQPNLPEVACSSGADTVFAVYAVVTPPQGILSNGSRVVHARLGRRRPEVTENQSRRRTGSGGESAP